jgi:predicted RNA binding protein YcfA (HicA-like mRNA interferase family)
MTLPESEKRFGKSFCERVSEPILRADCESASRAGFVVVRQRGSHIRLQKRTTEGVLKITVPAHRPVKRGTLSHILKAAQPSVEQFNSLL